MRLGIESGANLFSYSSVQQTVLIPSGAVQADLSCYYYPVVAPADGDRIYFCVLRASDDYLLGQSVWMDYNPTWHQRVFDLRAYAGQSIKVHFGVKNDGLDGVTAVWLDDVTLTVR